MKDYSVNYFKTPHPRKCKGRYSGKNKPARKKLRNVSKNKREQDKIYSKLRRELIKENPICQCWLKNNGWSLLPGGDGVSIVYYRAIPLSPVETATPEQLIYIYGALVSESCHHTRGRGRYYLAKETFMAVSNHWHRWIEDHKDQAIAKGWLHPEKNRRKIELPAK